VASPLFSDSTYTVGGLVEDIDSGEIALPDIQRPFVWTPTKARNLIDSMYRGFPVGNLLFWRTGAESGARHIGTSSATGAPKTPPRMLIVDGQQRLTCLYSLFTGTPVLDKDFKANRIRIAFNPSSKEFAVTDAAIEKDAEWLPDITELWRPNNRKATVRTFLRRLTEARDGELTTEEEDELDTAIDQVHDLRSYPFKGVELNASVDEEQVADVFVRINSEGVTLNTADFILTLMSVWWDDGRAQLESFAREAKQPAIAGPSPHNHLIKPDPDQMLRVAVSVGFRRAVLKHVYSLLRGKDLATGQITAERRDAQFATLQDAMTSVLSVSNWQEYLRCITAAGFVSNRMISSNSALLNGYALWLIGRRDFGASVGQLRGPIARWFFAVHTTGLFSSSPESRFEQALTQLQEVPTTAEAFVAHLDDYCHGVLTTDYWEITLPRELATSASKSPALSAYFASLNLVGAEVLFSSQKVSTMLDPAVVSTKGIERHHLFPKAFLRNKRDITENRRINQIANLAFVEWFTNIGISDEDPEVYWPVQVEQMLRPDDGTSEEQSARRETLARQMRHHGLPDGWQHLDYDEFLEQRRTLMASVVRDGWNRLTGV